jgi:hypothetical protein
MKEAPVTYINVKHSTIILGFSTGRFPKGFVMRILYGGQVCFQSPPPRPISPAFEQYQAAQ